MISNYTQEQKLIVPKLNEQVMRMISDKQQITNETKKIKEELDNIRKGLHQNIDEVETIHTTINCLQKDFVSKPELNELIDDIRESFEQVCNTTPRPMDSSLSEKITNIDDRVTRLESIIQIIQNPDNETKKNKIVLRKKN